ncbi:MAG: phosphocholine cytidylyltransferase family protein [Oscillospiraceae bacterium]|nr:phosphocholine cytidylyltransferase family protein [Oscillospiraceae bacterium]
MKAIILAAGRGSRMNNKTEILPKCMLEVCGKTILERCMESLVSGGIKKEDIGIVTGYRSECFDKIEKVRLFKNETWSDTGIFASLLCAEEWLKSEDCIICYSDIIFSPDVIRKMIDSESDFLLPYYTGFEKLWTERFENPLDDVESFRVQNGKLIDIGGRVKDMSDVMGQYMGLIKTSAETASRVIDFMESDYAERIKKIDMTSMLKILIDNNFDIDTLRCDELWLECDNANDIDLYEKMYGDVL